jgi:DNA-3-methyladenine glycosylase II
VRLDTATLDAGCRALAAHDAALGTLYARNGAPPLWRRDPGFTTLVKLVLEQQVSLASGAAAYRRLEARLGDVTPEGFLTLTDEELRAAAFSRQKARYVRLLAAAIVAGELDLAGVAELPDAEASAALQELTGIGPWTAANYLLFALGRPDAWPRGDRALVVSLGRALDRPEPPGYDEADELAEAWRPWRAVAARLLWHDYLGGPAYDPAGFA